MNNKQFLLEQVKFWKQLVKTNDKGSFPEMYLNKELSFLLELGQIQHPIDCVKDYLQNKNCKFSQEEILKYLNSFAYDVVYYIKDVSCFKSIYKNCSMCARCCTNEDGEPCENWTPCRGGHPNTANPCELQSLADYNLCLGLCKYCEHCPQK